MNYCTILSNPKILSLFKLNHLNEIFKSFSYASRSENIEFFLNNFDLIDKLNLEKNEKKLLYFILSNKIEAQSVQNDNFTKFLFKELKKPQCTSSLTFLALEKSDTLLMNVAKYFENEITHYLISMEPTFKEELKDASIGKKMLLLTSDYFRVFLPYQNIIMSEWGKNFDIQVEKSQIEKSLIETSSNTIKKIKI